MDHQGTTIEKNQVVTHPEKGEVITRQSVMTEPSDSDIVMARVERRTVISNWVIGAISALLGARFLLSLLGANPSAGFTKFIAAVTQPLVLPFQAMFNTPAFGQSFIDSAALVGLVVYPIVGYGIVKLLRAMTAPADPRGDAYTV